MVGISCLDEELLISLFHGISNFTRCWIVICDVILCLQYKPEESLEIMFTANIFPLFLIFIIIYIYKVVGRVAQSV
jgi:hypothetical protein